MSRTNVRPVLPPAGQRSFDDLGTALDDVTFCVIDLETTGGAAEHDAITEVGAVKLRGGRCEGTFQTLVNPGRSIPPSITVLTGITDAMTLEAPRIESVLPALAEFVGGAVVVGHNVRFDLRFLHAAFERDHRAPLANRWVDTVALARRLIRDEVPDCKLGTLAARYRLPHRPSHRALDDALATGDLLHVLLERAGRLGVTGLDDLLSLPTMAGHAQSTKLRLTQRLPRERGIYLFRDGRGRVLYVGKATNLRSRVRSYFSTDERRKTGRLLRETERIDHKRCRTDLEAQVLELRLIHLLDPPYNRQGRTWPRYAYVKLTLADAFPRLSIARTARDDGGLYLGPVPSHRTARLVAEAIESAVPLRRCTADARNPTRPGACAAAQLGVSTCPCAGEITSAAYRAIVDHAVAGMTHSPGLLLEPLRERMEALASAERFEEAADVRDRASALADTLLRQRLLDRVRDAERLVVSGPDGHHAELRRGRLHAVWATDPAPTGGPGAQLAFEPAPVEAAPTDPVPPTGPVPKEAVDELLCVARWLDRHHARLSVTSVEGTYASQLPAVPSFKPSPAQA